MMADCCEFSLLYLTHDGVDDRLHGISKQRHHVEMCHCWDWGGFGRPSCEDDARQKDPRMCCITSCLRI